MADPADHQTAADAAGEAGRFLVQLRVGLAESVGARQAGAEGDRQANDVILARLAERHPADSVLSEESADDLSRLDAKRVWIVDPLDGTREFGEIGRSDWAVHVALVEAGAVTAAAVALPAIGTVLSTLAPPQLPAWDGERPRIVVSRSRPPAVASAIADALGAELVPLGSAGAKAMAVVTGDAEVYAHSGGQYEWDSAAPVGVALAAGLHCSRIDGSPLIYNRETPYLPDLVICRPELADRVLTAIADSASSA